MKVSKIMTYQEWLEKKPIFTFWQVAEILAANIKEKNKKNIKRKKWKYLTAVLLKAKRGYLDLLDLITRRPNSAPNAGNTASTLKKPI